MVGGKWCVSGICDCLCVFGCSRRALGVRCGVGHGFGSFLWAWVFGLGVWFW